MKPQHVVLTGLMGSGKTSVGRLVADRLGRLYVDNDQELEQRTGADARTLATERGLDALHRLEIEVFAAEMARTVPAVLGAPASVIEDEPTRAAMRVHFVVWIDRDIDTLVTKADVPHRPAIGSNARETLLRQHRQRGPLFREVASLVVSRGPDDEPNALATRIVRAFRRAETGDREPRR